MHNALVFYFPVDFDSYAVYLSGMNLAKFVDIRMRYFRNQAYRDSLVVSMFLFCIALVVNYYAGTYASSVTSTPVGDVFLSNIPVQPVINLFVDGSTVFWIFSMLVYITHLQKIPFTLKTASLFIIIRSVFINLTHIGPFPDMIVLPPDRFINFLSFKGDLFFSGHTGFPLLMAFIFWDSKLLRYIFIGWSLFFATVVLLGHLHYTIDVASAFFITYTIFHLSQIVLKKDFKRAEEGIPLDR